METVHHVNTKYQILVQKYEWDTIKSYLALSGLSCTNSGNFLIEILAWFDLSFFIFIIKIFLFFASY